MDRINAGKNHGGRRASLSGKLWNGPMIRR